MKKSTMLISFFLLLGSATAVHAQFLIDGDSPATGSDLGTQPLVTAEGTVTFTGEFRVCDSDQEFLDAGAGGNCFDHLGGGAEALLDFDFPVCSIQFIYGGNSGDIFVEARADGGAVLDSFTQASTDAGQPAGPETLEGEGIRQLAWWETTGGSYAPLDNIYVTPCEAVAGLATFKVTKTFSDGREDEVDVHLSCNSGLPLEQDFTIAGGDPGGVAFVVTELQGTDTVCEVTESGGPAGYTPVLNGGEGCTWEGVTGGLFTCEITNEADPAEFTVTKEWVIEGAVRDEVIEEAQVTINCSSDILSIDGDEISEPDGSVWVNLSGDGDSVTVTVDTTLGSTSCSAYEDVYQSGIETAYTAECGNGQVVVELAAGGSTSCTITNTVFFEGIPTLSQYGMALMALLMLGLGFVGLRRFV